MEYYIIEGTPEGKYNASSKARNDVETILKSQKIKPFYIETKKEPYVSVNHSKNGSLYRTNSWKFDNVEFWITVPQFTVQKSDYDTYFIALNKKYLTKEKITAIEEAAKGFDDFKQVKEVDNVFIELNAQNRKIESVEKAVNQANN